MSVPGLFLTVVLAAEPWENPSVNAVNRLPARAMTCPCETEQLAKDVRMGHAARSVSRWVKSLNGVWDFKWKRSAADAEWEKSATVAVPGCWQLQGAFDPPLYLAHGYPFEKDAPRVMKEPSDKTWTSYLYRNPVGLYTTTFSCPWRWWFRRTILRFEGISSAFKVRLNGTEIGYSEDSRLPTEFDLTPHLKALGENVLEVEVYKYCDGSYLEDQDFWRLSGIFRDVLLVSEATSAPFDVVVETTLSDDLKNGTCVVRDERGRELKRRDFSGVRLWSHEDPNLYQMTLENDWGWWIFGGTDYRVVTFGFRKVEIRDAVLYLNGKRLLVKGVNRHEMDPATGYVTSREEMLKDIRLLKAFNINAVRTCHYPDAPDWYDLCDREGILLCCEANCESHGYGFGKESLAHRKDFEQSFVERGTRMVRTYRNHPSVIFWSMGNECGDGANFTAMKRTMKAIDPTRPIHYERAIDGENTDIMAEMYAPPEQVRRYVSNRPKKPYILAEYAHAMGNSTGGLKDYWDLAEKYPSFQGGFVWDFRDQGLWKSDARGKWLAYGGDFGDRPNKDNYGCNGIFDALRNPHPGAFEVKHVYRNVRCEAFDFATGKVRIRNRFLFRSLADFVCTWRSLNADGTSAAQGTFDLGAVAPGESAEFVLGNFRGDAVNLSFHADADCCAWDSFEKPFVPQPYQSVKASPAAHAFKLNFWRAPTDNDRGWMMPEVCRTWKEATESQCLPDGVKSDLKVGRLPDDAGLFVDWTLTVPEDLPPIPRVGLTFTVPKTDVVEYFGRGPWENYADRSSAATLGVYRASVGLVSGLADPKTGTVAYPPDRLNPDNYIEPGEQGYRTDCRRLTVGDVTVMAVGAPFGFNVWPYPQTMLEGKKHQWELSEADELTVNVDAVQMGVGGDNSWGARPHGRYLPGAGTYRLSFVLLSRASMR